MNDEWDATGTRSSPITSPGRVVGPLVRQPHHPVMWSLRTRTTAPTPRTTVREWDATGTHSSLITTNSSLPLHFHGYECVAAEDGDDVVEVMLEAVGDVFLDAEPLEPADV